MIKKLDDRNAHRALVQCPVSVREIFQAAGDAKYQKCLQPNNAIKFCDSASFSTVYKNIERLIVLVLYE